MRTSILFAVAGALLASLALAQPSSRKPTRALGTEKPSDKHKSARRAHPVAAASGPVGPAAALLETEANDTIAFADSLGGATDYDGDIPAAGDNDVVRIDLAADSMVTMTVQAAGASPIIDPDLLVTNGHGVFVNYSDDQDQTNLYPLIATELPAGTWYLHVAGVAGSTGTYRLSVQTAQASIPTLALNQIVNGSFPVSGVQVYRFTLPVEGNVTMSGSGGALDLYMSVHNALGGEVKYFDDRSGSNTDPLLTTMLPAGQYYLAVGEYYGAVGSYSLQVQHSAGSIPAAPCGTTASGSMQGQTTLDLYRLIVAPSTVTMTTGPGQGRATSDTSLRFYDRNLEEIFYHDDEAQGTQLYARLAVPLPAGIYFVGVGSFLGTVTPGTYALNGGCTGPFVPLAAAYGSNAGIILNTPEAGLHALSVGTPVPAQVSVSGLADGACTVLDAGGALVAFSDDAGSLDPRAGAVLGAGAYWLVARDYDNGTGPYDLRPTSLQWFTDAVASKTLNFTDKAGRTQFTFATVSTLPVPFPAPPPIVGSILVDLTFHIYLGATVVPPSGAVQSPINFNPYPVKLQGVAGAVTPVLDLRMTDLVQ